MLVLKPIEDSLAVLSVNNNAGETQLGQMLGYCCGRFIHNFGQIIDRKLASSQRDDQADTSRVGKH